MGTLQYQDTINRIDTSDLPRAVDVLRHWQDMQIKVDSGQSDPADMAQRQQRMLDFMNAVTPPGQKITPETYFKAAQATEGTRLAAAL